MDVLFTGTGAADFETALKCGCDHCTAIRTRGARNLRHYASALVDDRLLFDCGPTVPWRIAELDVPPAQVEALFITHSHEDHLDLPAIEHLLRARPAQAGPLPVYGNEASRAALAGLDGRLQLIPAVPGEAVEVLGRHFVPVKANHIIEQEETLNWLIGGDGGWVLYGTDTGWPLDETWDILASHRLSAAIVEATFGMLRPEDHPGYMTYHMNWPRFLELREELVAREVLGAGAPYIATHISLHHAPIHDELSPLAQPPVVVAHDGLRVRL